MPNLSDIFSSDAKGDDESASPFTPTPGTGDGDGGDDQPAGPDPTIAGGTSGFEGSDDFA